MPGAYRFDRYGEIRYVTSTRATISRLKCDFDKYDSGIAFWDAGNRGYFHLWDLNFIPLL